MQGESAVRLDCQHLPGSRRYIETESRIAHGSFDQGLRSSVASQRVTAARCGSPSKEDE